MPLPFELAAEAPQQAELEQAMTSYLSKFQEALELGFFDYEGKGDDYDAAYKAHGNRLIWSARTFDEQTMNGLGHPKIMPNENGAKFIQSVDHTELRGAVKPFSRVLIGHYADLTKDLQAVVNKVRNRGMDYLMDGVLWYNEEAAADLEKLSKKFLWTSDEGRFQLHLRSSQYRQIDEERETRIAETIERFENMRLPKKHTERHLILKRLHEVEAGIKRGDHPNSTSKDFFIATSDLTHFLGEYLGKKGLKEVGEKGNRPLKELPGGPVEQLSTMLSLLNTMVHDYEQCVTLHRDLLVGPRNFKILRKS